MTGWKTEYKQHRKALYRNLSAAAKSTVLYGPFKGMKLPNRTSWGGGAIGPKILGTYESELHDAIGRAISAKPDVIVDVGCAEGYYAVGLTRYAGTIPVIAYDINPNARAVCAEMATANGVGSRLDVRGECDHAALQQALEGKRGFVLCDCEGYERVLLDIAKVPALADAILLVELHDWLTDAPDLAAHYRNMLGETHDVEIILQQGRNPHVIPELTGFSELDRYMLVSEFRGRAMRWMFAVPQQRAASAEGLK